MQWYYLAIVSAMFSAFAAILEKKALFRQSALGFSFWLAIFNLLLSLPFFFFVDFQGLPTVPLVMLFGKSFLGAISFLFIMKGLRELQISSSLPLLALTPGLVAIVAFVILGDGLESNEVVGLLLMVIGTYVLQAHHEEDLLDPFRYIFKTKSYRYLLAALAIFTLTSVLDKLMVGKLKLPLESFMGFQHLFLAFHFSLFLMLFRKNALPIIGGLKVNFWLILLVAAATIVYRYSQIMAVKLGPVALVLSIKRISVFFAVLVGGTLFSEQHLLRKTIATAIMVGGAIAIIL